VRKIAFDLIAACAFANTASRKMKTHILHAQNRAGRGGSENSWQIRLAAVGMRVL
jgi:hypothetical protein